jgi:alpha-D-xyloside xylohydrolase
MTAALNMLATGAVGAWSMDTGGFAPNVNGSEWQELQVRWHQFATFVPLMRVHGTGGHEIWSIAQNSSSAVYAALKKTIELRYRLLPYIYSCQARNYWESYTLMRWPAFDFPEDRGVWGVTDEWMFGPALFVAPVTRYLARTRNVQFPAGGWFNFWNGEYSSKSGLLEVSAPFDQCPIYVRAGSIVPLGKIIQSTAEE